MKKFLVVILCMICGQVVQAQTFSELFRQKKTEEKYLLRQIAELQGYITLARKSYGVVTDGLGFIGEKRPVQFG